MARIYIEGRNRGTDTRRIIAWITKWRKRLHLTEWTIFIDLKTNQHKEPECLAFIDINRRYYKATINIYPDFWADTFKEQERVLVHELVHIPLYELNMIVTNLVLVDVETAVDSIENVIEWLVNVIWDNYEK